MIRINLLAAEREATKRGAIVSESTKVAAIAVLLLAVSAAGLGWWFWSLNQASATLDQQIAEAEQEAARLQEIIGQVAAFEQQRAQLQQRVALIEELRRGKSGPVHLLDQISVALPEAMWLLELTQEGNDVLIDGRCTTLTSLSDFIGRLEASGYFARPVEIVDSRVEPLQGTDLIRFTVRATFVRPEA